MRVKKIIAIFNTSKYAALKISVEATFIILGLKFIKSLKKFLNFHRFIIHALCYFAIFLLCCLNNSTLLNGSSSCNSN